MPSSPQLPLGPCTAQALLPRPQTLRPHTPSPPQAAPHPLGAATSPSLSPMGIPGHSAPSAPPDPPRLGASPKPHQVAPPCSGGPTALCGGGGWCPLLSIEHPAIPRGAFFGSSSQPQDLIPPLDLHEGKQPLQKQGCNTRPGTKARPRMPAHPPGSDLTPGSCRPERGRKGRHFSTPCREAQLAV